MGNKLEEEFTSAIKIVFGKEFAENEEFLMRYNAVCARNNPNDPNKPKIGKYGDSDSSKELMLFLRKEMRERQLAPDIELPDIWCNKKICEKKYCNEVIKAIEEKSPKYSELFPETKEYERHQKFLQYCTDGWNYKGSKWEKNDWIYEVRGAYHCYYNELDHYLTYMVGLIRRNLTQKGSNLEDGLRILISELEKKKEEMQKSCGQ